MPRVVSAGVPMRMPLGFIGGLVSKGMAFLFTVMPAACKRGLGLASEHALGEDIDEHEVGIGASGDDAETIAGEFLSEHLGVADDLLRHSRGNWAPSASPKAHGLGRHDVHQGPPC